jgi:hypothetical protein
MVGNFNFKIQKFKLGAGEEESEASMKKDCKREGRGEGQDDGRKGQRAGKKGGREEGREGGRGGICFLPSTVPSSPSSAISTDVFPPPVGP